MLCLLVKIQEKILRHVAAEPSLPGIGLDLELVMRNSTLEERLMALPLGKCANLLSDDQCRVASENTVAAAVVRWVHREALGIDHGDVEHEPCAKRRRVEEDEIDGDSLRRVIRVPRLSPLFAVAMLTVARQLTAVVGSDHYPLARDPELDRFTADLRRRTADDPSLPHCSRRLHSTPTALKFDWETSIAELAERFESGMMVLARSPRHFFAGLDWEVQLHAGDLMDNGVPKVGLCIFGYYPLLTEGPRFGATLEVSVLAPDGKLSLQRQFLCSNSGHRGLGGPDFFVILPKRKWVQSRMQKGTNSDGFLTFRVRVSDVL